MFVRTSPIRDGEASAATTNAPPTSARAAIAVAFIWLIPYTWDYLEFLTRKKSPVLRIRMHWIYGCYLLFVTAFAVQSVWRLADLFRPTWRDQI